MLDRQQLLNEAVRRSDFGYLDVADCLRPGETVSLPDGRVMGWRQLLGTGVRVEREGRRVLLKRVIDRLDRLCPDEKVVLHDGSEMGLAQLRTEFLRSSDSWNWWHAVEDLAEGETITLPDGRAMERLELVVEMIRTCTDNNVYNRASFCLKDGEVITLPDGRTMGEDALLAEHLRRRVR